MALIIRVGCSRKVSADYQSRGYTIDLQSEFDPRTLDNTDALADAADHLFQLANGLLDQQVRTASEDQGGSDHTPPPQDNHPVPARTRPADGRNGGNGHRPNGNGYQGGNGRGRDRAAPDPSPRPKPGPSRIWPSGCGWTRTTSPPRTSTGRSGNSA